MVQEIINEPVEVVASFKGKEIFPALLKWRKKVYKIKKLNLVFEGRCGKDRVYYFSVSDETNYFKLVFNTRDLSWNIEEFYFEG